MGDDVSRQGRSHRAPAAGRVPHHGSGTAPVATCPERITIADLNQYPEFEAFRTARNRSDDSATTVAAPAAAASPVFSTPKTNAGRRTIHLDDGTVNVLRTLRTEQAKERLAFGAGYREHGLVFCFEDGKPYHPDRVSRAFKERIESLRLPHIRLDDTRHTWATLALVAGVPVKVVQERLGHSTPAITMAVYQHASPGVDRQAADTVAARRGRLRLPPVYRLRCGTTFDSPAAPITPATKSAA